MKLVILASHPVQYHAPVFRRISDHLQDQGHGCLVVYLSDFSIQGYRDREFGQSFAWDEPLLQGYRSQILTTQGSPPEGFGDLRAPGWAEVLRSEQPTRVLITTLNYRGAVSATLQARAQRIPCTLRVETTDVSVARGRIKGMARSAVYWGLYSLFDSAIGFGQLNQAHLKAHGFANKPLALAHYCVVDRFADLSEADKHQHRDHLRQTLGIKPEQRVILFCGKLIPKKQPDLILTALRSLSASEQEQLAVMYVGSGEMAAELQQQAQDLSQVMIHFAGFKNQLELRPYYLAADLLVLPSRRQGEVWGLVVNEAHHAGLPCIVTEAVGSAPDFAEFPGFQVIPEGDAAALAMAIRKGLTSGSTSGSVGERQFQRYQQLMQEFTIETCARQMADFLMKLA